MVDTERGVLGILLGHIVPPTTGFISNGLCFCFGRSGPVTSARILERLIGCVPFPCDGVCDCVLDIGGEVDTTKDFFRS